MAARQVEIEKDGRRATVVESSTAVWVARGWKLVTESDESAEPARDDQEELAGDELAGDELAGGETAPDAAASEPSPKPADRQTVGAHQAPAPPDLSQEAQHG